MVFRQLPHYLANSVEPDRTPYLGIRSLILSVLCFFAAPSSYAGPALVDFGFESVYNNNISRTPEAANSAISGLSSRVSVGVSKGYVLSEHLSFFAKLGADYQVQHIDEAADYGSANIVLAANIRPFSSFSAARFKLSVQGRHKEYSNEFDGEDVYRVKLSMNNQLSDALSTQVGLAHRKANNEWAPISTLNITSWDTELTEYFLATDYRLDAGTLYTKLSYSDGDHVWTRPESGNIVGLSEDDIKTVGVEFGFNYPTSKNAVIDVLARHYSVRRIGSEMYDQTSLSIAYLHRLSF